MFRYLRLPAPLLATALAVACGAANSAKAASPEGVWIDNNGRGAVEIKPCGSSLCGHVVWVKNTNDAKGCGRQIIGDATSAGKNTYSGWIYSPEDKKRYNVELTPTSDGRLRVVGYAGIRLFSKTMYWTQADPNLVRCGTPAPSTSASAGAAAVAAPADKVASAGTETAPVQRKPDAKAKAPVTTGSLREAALGSQLNSVRALVPLPHAPAAVEESQTTPQAKTAAPVAEQTAEAPDETTSEAESASFDKPGLDKLSSVLDKVVKRSGNGDCKVDLPFVKVKFRCKDFD